MGASRTRRAVASLCLASVTVLTACGGSEPPPPPPEASKQVIIHPDQGPSLAGRLLGRGQDVVILSHQNNADMSSWYPLASDLADQRFLVLVFNFRGFCSGPGETECSQGQKEPAAATDDLEAAISWARENLDPRHLFLVGASMGGTASLIAASRDRVDAVASVSAPHSFEGLDVPPEVLNAITAPKLFIAGADDPAQAASAAEYFYDKVSDPKQIFIAPSEEHGAPMLETPEGAEARERLIRFLDVYRDASG